MSRHSVSGLAALAALAALVVVGCSSHEEHQEATLAPAAPEVPLPTVEGTPALEDENPDPKIVEVTLIAERVSVDIGGGKTVRMMGYNGVVPGPTLRARKGDEVIVHFVNMLPQPTTIHWHGLRIPDTMDGSPRVQEPVPSGGEFTYRFVVPDAGSYWYHPHVRANEQIEAGLYAPIVIWDDEDPTFDAERYLMLDDIMLDTAGRIEPPFTGGMPELMHGRTGNVLLTNGLSSELAKAEVEQGSVERWRIVNTSNSRTMSLELEGATLRVVATDGGKLPKPYRAKRIEVPVGQRYDLEVVYDQAAPVKLLNYQAVLNAQNQVEEKAYPAFTVDVAPSAKVPREIVWPVVTREARVADAEAKIVIEARQGGTEGVEWTLNGQAHAMEPLFTFQQGQTVKITLENKIGPYHPFHLHGQFFEVLGDASQPGLKDVVLVPGQQTVEILAYMDNPGRWMAHCHILEHAELGMMSEIVVTPKEGAPPPAPATGGHTMSR